MVKNVVKALVPQSWYSLLKKMLLRRFCPICGNASGRFRRYGVEARGEALCVHCGALERHRLIWLYLHQRTDLFDGRRKRVLHIAPEMWLATRLTQHSYIDYLSGDLTPGRAMVEMDITRIEYPDGHFDVIFCSHVLEHVPDDRRAMRELCRVLAPNGWSILQVPMRDIESTYEDFSITAPEEREKHFGQHDHVRWYGHDYPDRLRDAGFEVMIDRFSEGFSAKQAARLGIRRNENIYLCRKRVEA